MAIPSGLQDVLDTLELVPERVDRIQYLVSISEGFSQVDPAVQAQPFPESSRVPGCESEAFVFARPRGDGTLDYYFAVLNPQGVSAMALATILQNSFTGAAQEDITNVPDDIVFDIFGRELSMGKSLGLIHMVRMAKALAKQK